MNKKLEKNNQIALTRFYENLASKYEDSGYYTHPIGISRKKKVIRMLSPQKSDIICDLGCGDGNLSKFIVKKVEEVYGIDISPTRVRRSQKKGIKAICADVCSTPFKSDYFDKVICSEVIEHIINSKELLQEINRILKKGGTAVLTVPFNQKIEKTLLDVTKEDLEQMDYEEIKRKYHITEDHLNSFSEECFTKLLEEEKFTIKQIDYTHEYEAKLKGASIISSLGAQLIKRLNIAEAIYNKIIFLFYKEREDKKHHIIVQVSKM